ncbi:MAG: helicase-related protein, partial [Glaciihabitans sp.]
VPIRDEMIDALHLDNPLVVTRGFDRPNLRLEVQRSTTDDDKRDAVVEKVLELPKPSLLYVATRADTDDYAAILRAHGLNAAAYSAGVAASERTAVHRAFLSGALDVVVATSAFGMGIDKPNVRSVVHAAVTDSVDDYYQQIGRAGRDGKPATAILFYRPEDLGLRRYFVSRSPDPDALAAIVRRLQAPDAPSREELADTLDLSSRRVTAMLSLLEDAGIVQVDASHIRLLEPLPVEVAVERAVERAEQAVRIDQSRVEMMRGYAESSVCRRLYLLGYFGEAPGRPCGNCDLCSERGVPARAAAPAESLHERKVAALPGRGASDTAARGDAVGAEPFPLESRVVHPLWGEGIVLRNEPDRMTVFFDEEGYKTLSLWAVKERSLLRRIV